MIIFEIITEFISELFVRFFIEFIYGKIILGIPKLGKKGIEFIRVNLFGLQKKQIILKKILYKNIELTENLNKKE